MFCPTQSLQLQVHLSLVKPNLWFASVSLLPHDTELPAVLVFEGWEEKRECGRGRGTKKKKKEKNIFNFVWPMTALLCLENAVHGNTHLKLSFF